MTELYHAAQLPLDFSLPPFEHVAPDCDCSGKHCHKCDQILCIQGYNRNRSRKSGRQDECRECEHKYLKRYRQTHGVANRQKFHEKHPQYTFMLNLRKNMGRYGLTADDYFRISKDQNDLCAICKRPTPHHKIHTRLSVDHDHATGKVRGLLCHKCNTMLGAAEDNIDSLHSAIAYLELHKAREEGTD
jgi:Recombination endonuclease VII